MRVSRIYMLLFLLCFGISATAQPLVQNPTLIKGRLDNGLTYYIYPNDYPKGEAVYRLFIKSGSVFEEDSQKGLAHFLEHMAFNGTKHFPGDAMVRFLESKGAKFGKDLNAHTSFNETVYKLQLPSNDPLVVDSTMTILADWAGGLLLDSLEIESERGVIMSEWLSKTGPKYDAQNVLLNELLNNSRFAERIVIGDTSVIKNFPHKKIRDYYQKWYDPSLMAVAVVGDIDAKMIEKMIYDKFNDMKSSLDQKSIPHYSINDYARMDVKTTIHESLDKVELITIQLLPLLPSVQEEKDYLPYLERIILNRLFKARISSISFDDPPYANANIGISSFLNTKSILMASVELTPLKIKEGLYTFAEEIEQMHRYGFIQLEIDKVKKSYLANLKRSAESKTPIKSMSLMSEISSDFYAGNKVVTPQEEYRLAEKHISQIDSASIVRLLHKTVDWNKTHFILSSFKSVADELPSKDEIISVFEGIGNKDIKPYSKDIFVPDELLASPPVPGQIIKRRYIKDIDSYFLNLSNGAQVIFKPLDTDKEKIILSGFRKGGLYAMDSVDYVSGLYAGNVIALSGAGEFSRDALSHYLTGNTASIRFLIDKTRSGIAGSAVKDDIETLFQLLYLKWTQPKVDTAVYAQIKEKSIESYRTSNKTGSDIFYKELSYILQGCNYTNRELTDTLIEKELSLEKMIPVFDYSFGHADDYTFVIIGDYSIDEIEPYISMYLGGLPKGRSYMDYKYVNRYITDQPIRFEKHSGESPKAIVNLIFQRRKVEESFFTESLNNDIMKSVIRMKLLKALREDLGMVYSVSVASGSTLHPYPLNRQTISFSTSPENVDLLIERTLEELKKMVDDPLSFEKDLSDVKANLIKEMGLNIQKDSFWSGYIRNSVFNNETNWNYINEYNSIVNSITTRQIANIIKIKILDNKAMIRAILYPKNNN